MADDPDLPDPLLAGDPEMRAYLEQCLIEKVAEKQRLGVRFYREVLERQRGRPTRGKGRWVASRRERSRAQAIGS